MALLKLDYTLPEIAKEWSVLTNQELTEDDIFRIGIDSEFAFFLPLDAKNEIGSGLKPYPALCVACRIYEDAEIERVFDNKTRKFIEPEAYTFVGRVFVPAGLLRNLKDGKTTHMSKSIDVDRDQQVYFKEKVEIKKQDLVITIAEKKRFEVEYLMPDEDQTSKKLEAKFDVKSNTYPPELDIALKAWRAIAPSEGKGKPKARLRQWLDANTKLSNEAKERISIVANWDKTGGATRTE